MQHKARVQHIKPADFYAIFMEKPDLLLDIREESERQALYIPGSSHLPLSSLLFHIEKRYPDKEKPLYLLCHRGKRSEAAAHELAATGYTQVFSIEGGISAWEEAGFPLIREN